jgi:hypothetical protein
MPLLAMAAAGGNHRGVGHPMSKKPPRAKPRELPPLTGVQKQVMAHVMNSIALQDYEGCCSVERVAEQFQREANRFMPTLRKLAAKGYLSIEGTTYPVIYPTIDALRKQDPRLSDREAQKILKRVRR